MTWEVTDWDKETGDPAYAEATVWFSADTFHCRLCGLHLDSQAEIDACFDPVWELEDADWRDYELADNIPAAYEEQGEDADEP